MAKATPAWKIPKNLTAILAQEEEWEDGRWAPIMLSVIGGTTHHGRAIAQSWQIAFSPGDEFFDALNEHLADAGGDSDGYAWLALVQKHLGKVDPGLLSRLHTGDTESDTCVIWAENEGDGRALVEALWTTLHAQTSEEE
jgi:hypothetical protein